MADSTLESRTIRKVMWRLLPLLLAAYLVAYINRVNIGFALTMKSDLGLSASVFGLGAGLFFISYFIFEIPSNLILHKVGARRWIARIMLTWGLLSMAMALVVGVKSFMVVRFLLGAAEAGFFPGIILYLTYWFPARYRARVMGWFMVAIPLSLAITGPVSNLVMKALTGVFGMKDWQWLFVAEAVPTVLLSMVVLTTLVDRPREAKWLAEDEKAWLQGEIDGENRRIEATHSSMSLFRALTDGRTLALAFIYFANTTASYGVGFFLPQIIKGLGSSNTAANYLSALPFLAGTVGIIAFGEISDRFKGRRRQIVALGLAVTALGLIGAGALGAVYASIVLIGVAVIGTYGAKAPFWPLPSMFLTGAAAAGGIALINALGNLGGFVGPYAVGWVKDATGDYAGGLYMLGGLALAGAVVTLLLRTPSHLEPVKADADSAVEPA